MTGANFSDNWLLPIREHITSVIVDRTQRSGEKRVDKSLGFGIDDKVELF